MSRSRPTRPLIRYSLCPLRYSRRLTTTSPGFVTISGLPSPFFLRFPLMNSGPAVSAAPGLSASSLFPWGNTARCATSWLAASVSGESPEVPFPKFAGTASTMSLFSAFSVLSIVKSFSSAPSSTNRAASASSGSSRVIVTSASPIGGRLVVPLKMQSAMRSARRLLWLCSPSTQEIASTTLDFPQPFGPTMHVVPEPLNVTTVRSQNDLNPVISTLRSLSKVSLCSLLSSTTVRSCTEAAHASDKARGASWLNVIRRQSSKTQFRKIETGSCTSDGGDFLRRADRPAIARTHVWQVLSQRPSRLALSTFRWCSPATASYPESRMAVRDPRLARHCPAVKHSSRPCGISREGYNTATMVGCLP